MMHMRRLLTSRQQLVRRLASGPQGPVSTKTKARGRRRVKTVETILSDEEWTQRARDFTMRALKGLEAAALANAGSAYEDDNGDVIVDYGENRGEMRFVVNAENRTLDVISPVSGGLQYAYDVSTDSWLHVHDRHDLRGIIVRDFLRSGCIGLPDI